MVRAEARAVVVMAVVKEMAGTVEAKEEEVRAVATAEEVRAEVRVAVVMVVERVEVVRAEVTLVKLRFSLPDCTSILSG